jgi:hypothetical protein
MTPRDGQKTRERSPIAIPIKRAAPADITAPVQLIEVSDFGVRSAEIWLGRVETPLRFVLFPMFHLGTADYYEEVTRRLQSCQLVVAEGVFGRSTAITALTAAYRIPSRSMRLGLTTQQIDLSSLDVPIINPDVTGEQFDAGWRRLPIFFRLAVLALVPILGIWMALVGTRAALARYLEVDDLPTPGGGHGVDGAVGTDRGARRSQSGCAAARCLDEIHQRRSSEKIDVAVVYGAAHMRAVVHYLSGRYDYFAREAEWMTVFDF